MTLAPRRPPRQTLGLFLALALILGAGAGWVTLRDGLNRLAERGHGDLSLASDRLTAELQRFREIAVLLADHPVLLPLALQGAGDRAAAVRLMQSVADRSGASRVALYDRQGRLIVASDGAAQEASPPAVLPDYLQHALHGTVGFALRLEGTVPRRTFLYAVPVFSPAGPVAGAVTIRLDAEKIEATSRGKAQSIFFVDGNGVIFVSNRASLLFRGSHLAGAASDGTGTIAPRPETLPEPLRLRRIDLLGHRLWWREGEEELPQLSLELTQPLPVVRMRGGILLDALPAVGIAALVAALVAAAVLILGLVLARLRRRREVLTRELAHEARLNAELERRVAERTRALSDAVEQLRREVHDRITAQQALEAAQQDLLRAGKLSALGQMAAGLSHELNQPLMAIRSFAENGAAFIARDRGEQAAENLNRISDLAHRMGRIIRNLRAFARQEVDGIAAVDLAAAVTAALEITGPRIRQEGVAFDYAAPEAPVMVRGGEVRLQQVLVNLIANALDAMAGRPDPALRLEIRPGAAEVELRLSDTGPGIAEPERIFDPFYSTKGVGQAEGMGLGLSISYGIIESFGGRIRGYNRPEGGAEFSVTLTRAAPPEEGERP